MSRAIPYYIKKIDENMSFPSIFGVFILFSHGIYTYGTSKIYTIEIKEKYKYCTDGYTNFMVIDKADNHYRVNNSFWYLKYNSIEDWYKIYDNNIFTVKSYGFRIPILGVFPNIIKIHVNDNNNNNNYNYASINDYEHLCLVQ